MTRRYNHYSRTNDYARRAYGLAGMSDRELIRAAVVTAREELRYNCNGAGQAVEIEMRARPGIILVEGGAR